MFENNKILILGFARSGYNAAKFLVKRGNEVILNDNKTEDKLDKNQIDELTMMGVKLIFGGHPDDLLDDSFDYLIKNPGVPIDHKYVLKARELGVEVINEVEMAYRLLPDGVNLVSITGTNGKTTTTSLTYEIFKKAFGDKAILAGNIGFPLTSVIENINKDSYLIMEISCQQLENLSKFRPHVGAMTNLSPAHIDFLKSYDNYKRVKTKLFQNQSSDDIAILNYDNFDVINATKDIKSTKKFFSSKEEIDGCYLKDNHIYYYDEDIINCDLIKIVGVHNIENCMVAIMIAKEYGISNDVIVDVISNFKGVEHRLEYVDTINGVKYYNDTEATNIKSTQIALSSFKCPIILFLGGLERGQDFNELNDYMENVRTIIAIGQCRDRVREYAESINKEVFVYEHLVDGFDKVVEIANSGDVVLLSPASASWDQYKECEVRGAEFKDKVKGLR